MKLIEISEDNPRLHWKTVQKISDEDLKQAFEHYSKHSGPDTFSEIAARCISLIISNRKKAAK